MALSSHSFSQLITRRVAMDYLIHQPPGDGPFATVIFLHGAGAKGDDLQKVANESLPRLVSEGMDFPFLLLCPQCPAKAPGWPLHDLEVWIEAMKARHPIDARRIYLTGISMGGRGTWEMAYWHAEKFAAIVPLCGPSLPTLAPRLNNLPVWAWHGTDDEVVPVARTQEMIDALQRVGNPARFGRLENVGHECGRAVYGNSALWQWLAAQSL